MSRYYDPVTHRFVNADGYFQSGGNILDTNMNTYCRNNPVTNFDPTGEACTKHGCYYVPNCSDCSPDYAEFCKNNPEFIEKAKSIGDDYTKKSTNYDTSFSDGLSKASTGLTLTRGTVYSIAGAGATTGLSSAGIAGLGTIISTPLSIASHANNPYLTDTQKGWFIFGDCAVAAGGIILAFAVTNFWNPAGWVAAGIGIAYNLVTLGIMYSLESYVVNENKKAWCEVYE